MSASLAGKTILVTGASSGIGAELARQLGGAGARVALMARDTARLETVAAECRAAGGEALVVAGDVSVEGDCAAAVARTVAHYGQLDILVNNAGLSAHGRFDETTDLSIFERLMRVNFFGAVWCTAHALPHLKRSGGQVVAVSSLTGLAGVPTRGAYGATKHAMRGFFDTLRVELAGSGVAVTVIYPGWVRSEMHDRALAPDGAPYGERDTRRKRDDAMPAETCARLMIGAIARRERELVMTWRGKVGRVLMLLSPSLVDRFASRAVGRRES